ncbi:creatininase family protein [Asaia spathodeae]|uniref:creatininase family protein n=1 Tax=Asaia spathodeae TaxID=657016 RepID=UPI0021569652|nr:creatininase [Asaia spathodeae NBRC 105894]
MVFKTCLRSRARGFFLSVLLAAAPAGGALSAAHAETVSFERLTWTEIQARLQSGTDTIIVPVGGTEQSGPYIAVGKHNVRAQSQAERIAERLGHTLVAPVIAYVPEGSTTPRSSHMRFPGTISIPPAVFEGVIEGAGESFHVQGFHRVVFIADHGGYLSYLKAAVEKLNNKWHGQGEALYLAAYYDSIGGAYADVLRQKGFGAALGKHADLSDTALMLAIDPTMVRQDALKKAPLPGTALGVYGGDPRPATAALGQIGTEIQVQAALSALGKAR